MVLIVSRVSWGPLEKSPSTSVLSFSKKCELSITIIEQIFAESANL